MSEFLYVNYPSIKLLKYQIRNILGKGNVFRDAIELRERMVGTAIEKEKP